MSETLREAAQQMVDWHDLKGSEYRAKYVGRPYLAIDALRAALATPPVPAGDERERLAVEIDRHWLFRTDDGVFHCTADDWTYGPDDTIAEGDRLAPFSSHIADAILGARRG